MNTKQAIEFGEERLGLFGGKMEEFVKCSLEALRKQRPEGHWTEHDEELKGHWIERDVVIESFSGTAVGGVKCSECGYKTHNIMHAKMGCPFKYCPRCGARMSEVES